MREPLLVLDDQLRVVSANQSFYRIFQVTPREVEQQLLYHLCDGAWNIPDLRSLLEEVLPKSTSFRTSSWTRRFPTSEGRYWRSMAVDLNGTRRNQAESSWLWKR